MNSYPNNIFFTNGRTSDKEIIHTFSVETINHPEEQYINKDKYPAKALKPSRKLEANI
jgi:hypothetical protein